MSLALLFLPAVLAIAALVWRWRTEPPERVLAEAAPAVPSISGELDPLAALDSVLVELERATVRLGGAEELGEDAVAELERLADRLAAAAVSLERVG
jgi:hypothetical protein